MSDTVVDRTSNTILGLSMLIVLITVALSACCFLISFLLAKNEIYTVQQAGLYYWSAAASWNDAGPSVLSYTAPSVWYNYQPGQSLTLALVPAATAAATASAVYVLIAGVASFPIMLLRSGSAHWFMREVAIVVAVLALGFGFYTMVPASPGGYTIDLKNNLIAENGSAYGAQIQVTPSLTFSIVSQSLISVARYNLVAQNVNGATMLLAQGNYRALNKLSNLSITFINSHGNQE